MEVELKAGAKLDLLNKQELHETLSSRATWEGEMSARGRGVKVLRFSGGVPGVSLNNAGFSIPYTPAAGYVWSVRNFAAQLSVSTTTRLYIGDNTNPAVTNIPVTQMGAAVLPSTSFSNVQVTLNEGEYLVISATSASTILAYTMQVLEAPAELAWKLT